MKFKSTLALSIGILLILGLYLTLSIPDKPPIPEVAYGNERIKVLQGSYGWHTFTKGVESDSPIPIELVKDITPTVINPHANLNVKFDYKPRRIDLLLWNKVGPSKYNIDHNTIIMPAEKGIYVFEIRADWKQGDSIYAFKVDVK